MTEKKFDDTNRGSIWPNKDRKEDWQADFRGELNVDGVMYFVDAWRRPADASPKAPSLKFKVKRKEKQPQKETANEKDDLGWDNPAPIEDEIPFMRISSRHQP